MFSAYIDNSSILKERYGKANRLASYKFIICTKGSCRVSIYMSDYEIKPNCVITLLPNSYLKVIEQSEDNELYIVSFKQSLLSPTDLFTSVLEYLTHIIEFPVVEFSPTSIAIMCDYIKLLMRIREQKYTDLSDEFIGLIFKQFILGLGAKYKMEEDTILRADRGKALVMNLVKLIVANYTKERSAAFYAEKMHVTPQHLSTVVRQVTGRTITDIIAQFIIIDAQTKLISTDLSINEIATYLNFDDISTFGKYFKRHTKLSPRQYRNNG